MARYTPSYAVPRRYSTFWPRLTAAIIDAVLLAPIAYAEDLVLEQTAPGVTMVIWLAVLGLAYPAYSTLLHGLCGQTVGKMLTRIRVLDLSEAGLSVTQAIRRDLVLIVFTVAGVGVQARGILGTGTSEPPGAETGSVLIGVAVLGWMVAELVTMFWSPKRRAIHDLIAGSVVVRCQEPAVGHDR